MLNNDNEYISFIEIINKNELKKINDVLEDTPFNIFDFYFFPNRDFFNLLLIKDDFSHLFINTDIKIITFELPQCIKIYDKMKNIVDSKDWDKLFNYVENRDLINTYLKYYYEFTDIQKLELFKYVYSKIHFNHQFLNSLEPIMSDLKRFERLYNYEKFDDYTPSLLTVYKGVNDKSVLTNYSWTTDYEVALFFAKRFESEKPYIIKGDIKVDDIIVHIDNRNEKEILVDFDNVHNKEYIYI